MDRFFCALMLCAAVMFAPAGLNNCCAPEAKPVFFSMLFPQLLPPDMLEAEQGEAVTL